MMPPGISSAAGGVAPTYSRNFSRNAEIVRRLRAGESFGVVAKAFGMTRCAVAGVSHRAGGLEERRPTAHLALSPNPSHGEAHCRAKVTESDVREIRARRAGGETLYALAAAFGVTHNAIWAMCNNLTWKHVA